MNKIIEKINFKKVVIIYFIVLIIFAITLTIFLGNKYYNKLEFIYNYEVLKESFKKNYNINDIKKELQNINDKSDDIVDTAITNNGNILYSTSNIYTNNLTKLEGSKKYYEDDNNNLYTLYKKDKLFINLFLPEEKDEYEYNEEFTFNKEYNNKYIITYIRNEHSSDTIVLLSQISPVKNSDIYLKGTLSIIILFLSLYWIIVALMIYQNSLNRGLNPYIWTGLTLITNVIGVMIYLIYKYNRVTCNKCKTSNNKNNLYCTSCGNKINKSCKKCHSIISKKDKYCKSCGEKI